MRSILQHIRAIIDRYEGELPLNIFLKNYFKKHPILGSRDRKLLTEMAYVWYRCSKGFDEKMSFEKVLEASLFLCETYVHHSLQFLRAEWQGKKDYFLPQKLALLEREKIQFNLEAILPFNVNFSEGITRGEWLHSMFRQNDLFIRYRKNPNKLVAQLQKNAITFQQINEHCFALPNATKLQSILLEEDYVVQDASSQKTGDYFLAKDDESWWDCCSGAGGKSLLLKDIEPKVKLTVSDKRESILRNLKERFALYGIEKPEILNVDAANKEALEKKLKGKLFDHIICDVPCSGSGTWSRTPEQLFFFDNVKIPEYSTLQSAIANNVSHFLKPGGRLIYITCSVFQQENEGVIKTIKDLELESNQLINGIELKADSMFVAVLRKL